MTRSNYIVTNRDISLNKKNNIYDIVERFYNA